MRLGNKFSASRITEGSGTLAPNLSFWLKVQNKQDFIPKLLLRGIDNFSQLNGVDFQAPFEQVLRKISSTVSLDLSREESRADAWTEERFLFERARRPAALQLA